jgi:hypothetical protein
MTDCFNWDAGKLGQRQIELFQKITMRINSHLVEGWKVEGGWLTVGGRRLVCGGMVRCGRVAG